MQNENKVGFISLGCPKALVDSERILTQLQRDGYAITPSYDDANIVVVNTCGFIDSAKDESLSAIEEALEKNGKVIVTGCLGAQSDLITEKHPKVLAVTGPHAYEHVVGQVREHLPLSKLEHNPFIDLLPAQGVKLTPKHYSYLKISEGCNHKCSFCIIPSMRGKLVSRPVADILDEAQRLVTSGTKELLVISQDTSAYGVDQKYSTDFWQGLPVKTNMKGLCEALAKFDVWIRLHYVYPYPHVDEIIPLMAEGKVLPYLDIPFQHASPKILKAMRRPAATENTLKRLLQWRKLVPDITIRSTFIVGFPGETEKDFEELLNFLNNAQLDRVGCFKYSAVDGADANKLDAPLSEEVKQERWERFMELQQSISKKKLAAKIGTEIEAIVDKADTESIVARSTGDAPEIDGLVYVESSRNHKPGDLITVKIVASDEYDLYGIDAD